MKRTFTALALFALIALPARSADATMHFDLKTSTPEDGATVASVEQVQLWFTQVPQDDATRIRVINASGELVEGASAAVQDEEDKTAFHVTVEGSLAAGEYTISWRSMAADGHVVRGDFGFNVAPN